MVLLQGQLLIAESEYLSSRIAIAYSVVYIFAVR